MADRPDATASAQLGASVILPKFLCYLDILAIGRQDPFR